MNTHPVHFDVIRPPIYDRWQLAVRVLISIVLGILGASVGWIVGLLYLALPLFAAISVSDRGSERYLTEVAPRLENALRWVLSFFAYVGLLTDRLPTTTTSQDVTFTVERRGFPTVQSALLRIFTAIPTLLLLIVVGLIGGIVYLVTFVSVLLARTYSQGFFDFQRGVLRLLARMFAYQASLVDGPAPFELDTSAEEPPFMHEAR